MNHHLRLWPLWLLVCSPLVLADDTNEGAKTSAASATSAPTKPPDDELLEFLGSVDEEADAEWIEFLSNTDISKAARAKNKAPAAAEASSK